MLGRLSVLFALAFLTFSCTTAEATFSYSLAGDFLTQNGTPTATPANDAGNQVNWKYGYNYTPTSGFTQLQWYYANQNYPGLYKWQTSSVISNFNPAVFYNSAASTQAGYPSHTVGFNTTGATNVDAEFVAPAGVSGAYTISATFTQLGTATSPVGSGTAEVFENGVLVSSVALSNSALSTTFTNVINLTPGEKIDFVVVSATGIYTSTQPVEVAATITPVPAPAGYFTAPIGILCCCVGVLFRRKRKSVLV